MLPQEEPVAEPARISQARHVISHINQHHRHVDLDRIMWEGANNHPDVLIVVETPTEALNFVSRYGNSFGQVIALKDVIDKTRDGKQTLLLAPDAAVALLLAQQHQISQLMEQNHKQGMALAHMLAEKMEEPAADNHPLSAVVVVDTVAAEPVAEPATTDDAPANEPPQPDQPATKKAAKKSTK